MLPIYKAQGFEKVLLGGKTRPWVIYVFIENQPFSYVVKLYKEKDVNENHTVAKEVYSSVLASSFGLSTPRPALIEFTDGFVKSLPIDLRAELSKRDDRIKFGCENIDASFAYIDTINRPSLRKYDFENIFIFDNLILNADRRDINPNILLKGNDAYLIDHELTFPLNENTIAHFKSNYWVYNTKGHIFYNYLKNSNITEKKGFFLDFSEKLKKTDFNILDSYSDQMIKFKHDNPHNYSDIKNYLCTIKQNSDKFANLVRRSIA
jgi:hypothetical protein